MPLKTCACCKEERPLVGFSSARNRPDGRYNYCRSCATAKASAAYYAHREEKLRAQKEYAHRPHVRQRIKAYNKEFYAKTRDEQLAASKKWAKDNRPHRRAYVQKWNDKNRDKVRSYQKNYKAKKRSTGRAAVPLSAWNLIKATFRNRCVYCGKECRLEQDHVTPLARGGEHLPHNIVPACRHCNATKLYNEPEPFWWTTSA